MSIGIEIGDSPTARAPFTPDQALELKAKARELFRQGLEYSAALDEALRSAMRAKPVWEQPGSSTASRRNVSVPAAWAPVPEEKLRPRSLGAAGQRP